MKEFIEKWKTDSKFKAKVQLILYTSFVVFVSIFALSSRDNTDTTNKLNLNHSYNENGEINTTIKIPETYNYITNITLNNINYQYKGKVEKNKESISKIKDEITTNYMYEEGNYYQQENNEYVLTTKENVYDIVSPNYLKLETINKYLSQSTKKDDKYIVYLKDIILGNDSEEYITITFTESKVNIDYTNLIKLFDETTENLLIEIIIE